MKPVLHSVSYAGFWGQATLRLEEFIPHAAELGYSGVMLMTKRPHLSPLEYGEEKIAKLVELLENHHLTVAALAGYSDPSAGFTATAGPFAPLGEMQLVNIRFYALMAKQLKAPIIRLLTGLDNNGVPYLQLWNRCVDFMRQACDIAAEYGVTIGIQNHDDVGGHYLAMADLIDEIDRPNCKACFDAWSPALHGDDLREAALHMGSRTVHTTVADYVKRPRFRYHHPHDGNVFEQVLDDIRAAAMGDGFIDYKQFFDTLQEIGFDGTVAYEMCSPIQGGGSMENLDRYARRFIEYMKPWTK
ncbi:MAG: sugar phosphate isomerase/epimerase [Candidatus Omnitrophota bacterium]|jgi:sugar phosphate isomerase/epimerase|nr:MAG: sugar phosphate isomerase/epimerase [Candidatus Omnitrophota bacterium]